jgi:hypothetical protein
MREICPLLNEAESGNDVPSACLTRCFEQWDMAVVAGHGEYDIYKDVTADTNTCQHPEYQFSSHALQAPERSAQPALRFYTIVDECVTCDTEVGETVYRFECPNIVMGL